MIGRRGRRVAPVIGRNDQNIVLFHRLLNFREGTVYSFQRVGIAEYIVPMAVQHIRIDEIDKDQPLFRFRGEAFCNLEPLRIVSRMNAPRYPSSAENIIYFSDRDDGDIRFGQYVQHGFSGRFKRKILPVLCTREFAVFMDKRTRYDPSDRPIPRHDPSGNFTYIIEF